VKSCSINKKGKEKAFEEVHGKGHAEQSREKISNS